MLSYFCIHTAGLQLLMKDFTKYQQTSAGISKQAPQKRDEPLGRRTSITYAKAEGAASREETTMRLTRNNTPRENHNEDGINH